MKGRFLINMKIGEEIFFSSEKNLKGVCEWEMAYKENPEAEEFKVYERNNDGLTYSLIHSTYKRRIGFQKMKVKDFISILSADTRYKIIYSDNPDYIAWWGQGNNCNTIYNEDEILGIQWHKKGIIIYI